MNNAVLPAEGDPKMDGRPLWPLTTSGVDVGEVITSMQASIRRLLGNDVVLVTRISRECSCVKVDRVHVEQLITNLVANARDAMPTGGELAIETHHVLIDEALAQPHGASQVGPHVMLEVRDSGVGMDGETQLRIFEPFYTTKRVGEGAGLGLSTVFGIVQQSGGSVWLHSEPGKGTSFRVFHPQVGPEVQQSRPQDAPTTLRGSETILVVDDEAPVREVVVKVLESQGYLVLAAAHGDEALRKAAAHPGRIDLLLSDVMMPQMGGPELARQLILARPDVKLLFMSGYMDDRIAHEGLVDAGVFIQKPFSATALSTKVRALLDTNRVGECGSGP